MKAVILVCLVLVTTFSTSTSLVTTEGSGVMPLDGGTASPLLSAISMTSNSISLNWTQPNDTITNIDLFEISYLYIGPCADVAQMSAPDIPPSVGGMVRLVNITDLEEFSDYMINLTAVDIGGQRSEPASITLRTLPDRPGLAPQGSVQSTNASSVTVQWEEVPCVDQNGIINGYLIQYFPSPTSSTPIPPVSMVDVMAGSPRVFVIEGLIPRTPYQFFISAFTEVDNGPILHLVSQTTTNEDVGLFLRDQFVPPNSVVTTTDIGADDFSSLLCITNSQSCCNVGAQGEWYFPNSSLVTSNTGVFRSRGPSVVRLNVDIVSFTEPFGLYRCEVPDVSSIMRTIFVGLYSESTGNLVTPVLSFNYSSLTLTCTTSGGPPSTLTWLRDGTTLITDGMNFAQSQTVVDMVTSTYQTFLTAGDIGEINGVIQCVAGNARGMATSNNLTVTIPAIGFLSTSYAVGESAGSISVTAGLLKGELGQEVQLRIQTNSLMGQADSLDFQPLNSIVTFSPTNTGRTIDITIIDDPLVEGNENFTVSLEYASEIGPESLSLEPQFTTVTIVDNDFATIGFDASAYAVSEDSGSVDVCAIIGPVSSSFEATITFSVENGTAVEPRDFISPPRQILFSGESNVFCLSIVIVDDMIFEVDKQFNVTMTTSDGLVVLNPSVTTVTISDNEEAFSTIPVSMTSLQDNGPVTFNCISNPSDLTPLSLVWSIKGVILSTSALIEDLQVTVNSFTDDSTGVINSSLTVIANSNNQIANIQCLLMDPNRTPPTLAISDTAVLTLQFARVELESTAYTTEESDDLYVCAIITESSLPANVNTSGIRFTASDNTATVGVDVSPAVQTVQSSNTSTGAQYCSNWTIIDDDEIEGMEMFQVGISSDDPFFDLDSDRVAVVTILDNDVFSIGFEQSQYAVSESSGSIQPCLSISVPPGTSEISATISVMAIEGTATSPVDYELQVSGDIIIPSTTTIYCIDVAIYDDVTPEPGRDGKNFTLVLASSDMFVEFGNQMTTVTIYDDDVSLPTVTIDPIPEELTSGQQLAIVCRMMFEGGVRQPIDIVWLDSSGTVVNGSSVQISSTVQTPTSGVSTLTFPSLFVSQAGQYTCRGTVDTYVFGMRTINRAIPLTVQIAPVSIFLFTSPSGNIFISQNASITCSVGADASADISLTPSIEWDVSYTDDGELIMESFVATDIVYITEAVFSSTLQYTPILRDMVFSCSAFVRPNPDDQQFIIESETTNSSQSLAVQLPQVSTFVTPPTQSITDVSPFNSYTIVCNATLPSDATAFDVMFSWAAIPTSVPSEPPSGNVPNTILEILNENETISIEYSASTSFRGNLEYISRLVVNHTSGEVGTLRRRCIISLLLNAAGQTGQIVSTQSVDATVTVRGPSLPNSIPALGVPASSHELAVIAWVVPSIAYTPEIYTVEYQTLDGDVLGPLLTSEPILGNTDLSATNQNYQAVLKGLLPSTTYSYRIVSTNQAGIVFSSYRNFNTQSLGVYTILPGQQPANLTSIPIGAYTELRFRFSTPPSIFSSFTFYPLDHTPLQQPNIMYDSEADTTTVTYQNASPSLSGTYILCKGQNEVKRKKREAGGPGSGSTPGGVINTQECGESITLNVVVPTLSISTNLLVAQDGDPLPVDSVQVTCLPSDPLAPVRWRTFLGTFDSLNTNYNIDFEPQSTRQTAEFSLVVYEGAPPSNTEIFICDLINVDDSSVEINPQNVTVRFIQNSVAILHNDNELSTNAVINTFPSWLNSGQPVLSLRCFSTSDNPNLVWEARNVSSLPSGIVTEEDALTVPFLDVLYHEGVAIDNRDTSLLVNPISALTTGYYSCRSGDTENGYTASVFATQIQPYWEVKTPSRLELPIGAQAVFRIAYADFSDGSTNVGNGFTFSLTFVPCVAPPDTEGGEKVELVDMVTNRMGNEFVYSFTVYGFVEHAGTYEINATHIDSGMSYYNAIELIVTVPHFVEFDTTVVVRQPDIVTLRCVPNDTQAPVLWTKEPQVVDLNDRPDLFSLSPPGLNHTLTFNATMVSLEFDGIQELLGNPLIDQLFFSTYSCGFIQRGEQIMNLLTALVIQQEEVRLQHRRSRQKIFRNTVINNFRNRRSRGTRGVKRFAGQPDDYAYYYDGTDEILEVDCQGAQGDHEPLWLTDNTFIRDARGAVQCDQSINSQYLTSNYTSRLRLYNIDAGVKGIYTCTSQISGQAEGFELSTDNPYVERVSSPVVTVIEGDSLTLQFRIAVNSNGNSWMSSRTSFNFMNTFEVVVPVQFESSIPEYPQDYVMTFNAVTRTNEGIYTAVVQEDTACESLDEPGCPSSQSSITVNVIATCPEEVSGGILWPRTLETNAISLPCTRAGSRFRAGTSITRTCQSGGVWNEVDLTSCTLDSTSSEPFLIVYFSLVDPESGLPFGPGDSDEDRRKKRAIDVDEETLVVEMEDLLRGLGVTFTMVTVTNIYNTDTGLSISFEIVLSDQSGSLANFMDFVTNGLAINGFAGYPIDQNAPIGFMGVVVTDSCQCGSSSSDKSIGSGLTAEFLQLCAGLSLSPCNCSSNGNCQCRPPYVGDGSRCTLDSDGDGFPDLPLDSRVCFGAVDTPYCIQDVCPTVHNIDQDPAACQPVVNVTVFTGCPFGPDPVWSIEWPNTERDTVNIQRCPGQLDSVTGQATRYCDNEGVWSEPDVLECQDMQFVDILDQASFAFSRPGNSTELVQQTVDLTMQLADITEPDVLPLLPTSLNTTIEVLSGVLNVLEDIGNDTTTDANEFVIDVFNNVLERNNTQGWMALQTSDAGSQVLLDNAERFGVLLARSQNNSGSTEPQRFSRSNIAISAKQYDTSQEVKMDDLKFPQEEDLVNYSLSVKPAAIQIPPGLLQERLSQQNDEEAGLPIVFILFQNLEAFLPSSVGSLSNNTRGASVVISSQVGERGTTQQSQLLKESPLSLNFTFDKIENSSQYRCVFWKFSQPVGNGEWISDGVSTVGNSTDDLTSTVQCASTHLTSFAVLVDVAGGLQNISQAERTALQVVSYIGCVISVICLLITVIFFLSQGKKLLTSVHYFVHLNLSISLLLAYFVFIVGVETAVGNAGACAFVAVLLHYLFLSSFCWMMCEGVMLYLLLVVVFSRVAKTWWFFLLLGYLIPIPFVVITLAVRWQYYGVSDAAGNLQFCWLSVEQGTIFGFVAPMMMIILINVVFLCFALRALWKNKRSQVKRSMKNKDDKAVSLRVAKSILLASIVLLPLLGLTWVFGLLTVNSNTTFFAWIFTILNSLQGLAILFFHVIRSDKIWSKIGPRFSTLKRRTLRSTLRKYNMSSGSTTYDSRSSTLKYKTKSSGDTEMGLGTLKSTLPRDGSLKHDLSSSVSEHHSQSEFTETKIDLAADTANEKLPTVQEEIDDLVQGESPSVDGESPKEAENDVIANPTATDDVVKADGNESENDKVESGEVNENVITNPNALSESCEVKSEEEAVDDALEAKDKDDETRRDEKDKVTDVDSLKDEKSTEEKETNGTDSKGDVSESSKDDELTSL